MNLKGKVALITGASRGIGRATALRFAQEGAKVIVNYNQSEKYAREVIDLIRKNKGEAIAIRCDVSQEKEVKKMVEESIKKFGRIDILVNNAAIVYDIPFFKKTVEQWKRTFEVNLLGQALCIKHVAPHMLKQKSGNIINISSTNGIFSMQAESIDYDTTKAGTIMLTNALAAEFAPYIRVNTIAPGWVDTDINKTVPKAVLREEKQKIFVRRIGKPEEIAAVAAFLASDDASYVNKSTVIVDGGYKF